MNFADHEHPHPATWRDAAACIVLCLALVALISLIDAITRRPAQPEGGDRPLARAAHSSAAFARLAAVAPFTDPHGGTVRAGRQGLELCGPAGHFDAARERCAEAGRVR